MFSYNLDHLQELEAESIYVIRETAAQFNRPVILFSGGKDSIVVSYLAYKAFYPAKAPFDLLHIDTGHNFPETILFRDQWVDRFGFKLEVRFVQDSINTGRVVEESGSNASRNTLQSVTVKDALRELQADAAIGGARRDEEKARAKERFFSRRDAEGHWNPSFQRPELWSYYNGRHFEGEHFRIFPISNWTELDIWNYIQREQLPVPSLYFSHDRPVFYRNESIYAVSDFLPLVPGENQHVRKVRFRTVGDMTCTGAIESTASTIREIIEELSRTRTTERGSRIDDRRSESAMEDRKREGYF